MNSEDKITKITRFLKKEDGAEVRIVATAMYGIGLEQSVDVYVHHRESLEHPWKLCDDQPHPDYKSMSVDEYQRRGRSEMLRVAGIGQILKTTNYIGQPMSVLN